MGSVAKGKQEFIAAWDEEFRQMMKLGWSLPISQQEEFCSKLSSLKIYVYAAAEYVYPENDGGAK